MDGQKRKAKKMRKAKTSLCRMKRGCRPTKKANCRRIQINHRIPTMAIMIHNSMKAKGTPEHHHNQCKTLKKKVTMTTVMMVKVASRRRTKKIKTLNMMRKKKRSKKS